jgi:hypothetical protein
MSSLAKGVSSKLTASDRDFQFAARETRVSNIIQTGARDRPKLTNARRFPSPTASARDESLPFPIQEGAAGRRLFSY